MHARRSAFIMILAISIGCTAPWRVERSPSTSPGIVFAQRASRHLKKGNHWYAQGNLDRAQTHFEKAIAADDGLGVAWNNLGLVQFDAGEFQAAMWSFQSAVERMPDSPEPLNNLGLTYETAERLDEALGLYQQAHMLAPSESQYFGNAVRTRRKLGEPVAALVPDLQQLLLIENRPEWREWVQYLLHYQTLSDTGEKSSDDSLDVLEDADDARISIPDVEEIPREIPLLSMPLAAPQR